jgi:hypothetical protein
MRDCAFWRHKNEPSVKIKHKWHGLDATLEKVNRNFHHQFITSDDIPAKASVVSLNFLKLLSFTLKMEQV